jgi:phosphatidylinositol alpha-1,6-mannosyltransferase
MGGKRRPLNGTDNIRVLFLSIGLFDKGGISRYGRYQTRAFTEIMGRANLKVVSLRGPGRDNFETPPTVDYHADDISIVSYVRIALALLGYVFSFKPDILWCGHLHLLPLCLLVRLMQPKVRLIVNVYGEELWSGRGWIHHRTLPRADMVVADCHFSREFVISDYRLTPDRVLVIWDCVDLAVFRPAGRSPLLLNKFKIPTGPSHRYILTLGRIDKRSRYKGYDRLLDALARLDDPDVVVLFAGDGDDRGRLRRRSLEMGLASRTIFLGWISETELTGVYNLSDLFVLVSDRGEGRGEGLPLAVLEALACGKPVIVGDEDGSSESVVGGRNGRVVSARDANALTGAIHDILSNESLRLEMGVSARTIVEEHFGYGRFRAQTMGALQRALGLQAAI